MLSMVLALSMFANDIYTQNDFFVLDFAWTKAVWDVPAKKEFIYQAIAYYEERTTNVTAQMKADIDGRIRSDWHLIANPDIQIFYYNRSEKEASPQVGMSPAVIDYVKAKVASEPQAMIAFQRKSKSDAWRKDTAGIAQDVTEEL